MQQEEDRKNGKPKEETMTEDQVETMLIEGFDEFLGFVNREFGMRGNLKVSKKPSEAYIAIILSGITQIMGSQRYIVLSNRVRDDRINAKLNTILKSIEGTEVPHPGNYVDQGGEV